MRSDPAIIYLAGIVDGEGHFYLAKTRNGRGAKYQEPRVLFVQSEKNNGGELVQWAKQNFGGCVSFQKSNGMFRWQLSGKRAVSLAQELFPYLIVKKKQIRRILSPNDL